MSSQAVEQPGIIVAPVRHVTLEQSQKWLSKGWADIWRSPGISLGLGAVPVVAGYLIFFALDQADLGYLIIPFTAGFMLVGPIMALGFYQISRRHEANERATLWDALTAWRFHGAQVGTMALILTLLLLVWVRVATLLLALFVGEGGVVMDSVFGFVGSVLQTDSGALFLIVGTGVGAAMAAFVFAIGAVSVPLLMDRDGGCLNAINISIQSVLQNPQVMWGWAFVIVLVTGMGLATFFLGLIVALPLVGHASWHAYRDLVG